MTADFYMTEAAIMMAGAGPHTDPLLFFIEYPEWLCNSAAWNKGLHTN